jgi:biotin-(acetyl-CoA carboxylase) ligase
MTAEEVARIPTPATSMYLQTLHQVDKEVVLTSLFTHLKESFEILDKEGFSHFYTPINELLAFKGTILEVELRSKEVIQGRLVGIDIDGALLLQLLQEGQVIDELFRVETGRILKSFVPKD